MEGLGSSFRDLVSCFFRVYGKGNCNEKEPLASIPQEPRSKGLNRLIGLFGHSQELKRLKEDAEVWSAKRQAFAKASSCNIIRPAKNKTEYKENCETLGRLNEDLALIKRQNDVGVVDADIVTAQRVSAIRRELSNLYRERVNLQAELETIEDNNRNGEAKAKSNFDALLEFFPQANLRLLDEIEGFHKSLKRVLQSERDNTIESIKERLRQIEERAFRLEEELDSLKVSPTVPEAVLQQAADLVLRIDTINRANDLYDEKADIEEASKASEDRYANRKLEVLNEIAEKLNGELADLNESVCGPQIIAPQLKIDSTTKYDFQVPNDSGTGSLTRSTFLLDYAILSMTTLPVIAHDTVMTKQVEDVTIIKLLELYEKSQKQLFVAIDKAESFEDGRVPKIIEDNVVLRLSEGHELFGRAFNRLD